METLFQVFFKECEYIEKQMTGYIIDDLNNSSDESDESDEE